MRIEGIIVSTFSESANGAPVVVSILQDDETHRSISFERRQWNEFIDSNPPLFFGQTRVVAEGEDESQCGIRLDDGSDEDDGYALGCPCAICRRSSTVNIGNLIQAN